MPDPDLEPPSPGRAPGRLLAAIDLARHPETVVDEAGRWARHLDAAVDLVYASPMAALAVGWSTDPTPAPAVQGAWDKTLEAHRRRLQELMARVPQGHRGEARVEEGSPGPALEALSARYDYVLVGTHGRTGLERLWMGSVAERVVRTCPRPVIVVRIDDDDDA